MIKKIDSYIILDFIQFFFLIFTILFFIFSIQFAFQEVSKLGGKGLTIFQISKVLFYLGTTTIPIIVPISVLLTSIISFGGFGERFELIAMTSSGISLSRIMLPTFILSVLISIGLFFISNNVLPKNYKRAKNLLFNAIHANPALRFIEGQFSNSIPGFTIKIDRIYGNTSDSLEKIIIHKKINTDNNYTTIIAKSGILYSINKQSLLKFELYNGIIYDTKIILSENYSEQLRQNQRVTQFKVLTIYINIAKLLNKSLEQENIHQHFRFYKYHELNKIIDRTKNINDSIFNSKKNNNFINIPENYFKVNLSSDNFEKNYIFLNWNNINNIKKINILKNVIKEINEQLIYDFIPNTEFVVSEKKQYAQMIIHQQRIITFSLMSSIFFLIGAALGVIIKKGGLGIPLILAIFIFIVWFLIFTFLESESKLGNLNPYFAAWLPNFILSIIAFCLLKNATKNNEILNFSTSKKLVIKIINFLSKKKY